MRAVAIGSAAQRALAGDGAVLAVFERSFYVATEHGLACIGPPSLGAGPLNLLCTVPAGIAWPGQELRRGAAVRRLGDGLVIAGVATVDLAGAPLWRPPAVPADWSRERLRAGLAALAAWHAPKTGLAALVPALARGDAIAEEGDRRDALLRIAVPGIAALDEWLAHALAGSTAAPPPDVDLLIGLGPGLTPSGDDLVGGALIAFHALDRVDVARRLGAWALPLAAERTGAISAAHLASAAIDGEGSLALHEMLAALVGGEAAGIAASLVPLAAIGHSSGWDMLAGAALACRRLLDAPP